MRSYWRVDDSWIAVERSGGSDRELELSFADEVAIDFPAVGDKVERMRLAFDNSELLSGRLRAEITLSRAQAGHGAAVPLEVPLRWTCRGCGGRGEVWGDPCVGCGGSGHALTTRRLTVSVPPGVADGALFSFSVSPPRGPRTRVEIRVAVT
jgi:hypothetical protein